MYGGRRQVRLGGDRRKAMVAAVAAHLLIGYALVSGLATQFARQASDSLKTFDVPLPPPPADPPRQPVPVKAPAPPAAKAKPRPVVAPTPEVPLPAPPLPAAPVEGAGAVSQSGTAGAGAGSGASAGGSGTGSGSGGGGTGRAVRIAGDLHDSDYPKRARRTGAQGSVGIGFKVRLDGRVEDCEVLRSSGNAELDSTTCRLIEKRFRYRPATDPAGNPVASIVRTVYDWTIGSRR